MAGIAAGKPLLYEQIAARIGGLIEQGAFRPGHRIPSIRELSRELRVSINTVQGAYVRLESQRLIEARPQSGYYVCSRLPEPEARPVSRLKKGKLAPQPVALGDLAAHVIRSTSGDGLVPLGQSGPDPRLLPVDKLNRILAAETRRLSVESVTSAPAEGTAQLREALARRSLAQGCCLSPEDIVITSGCMEAITLALQATCRPGNTVAIAAPVFYTFLNSIQWMGLKVLEIPCCPRSGVNLDVLEYALRRHRIHACLLIPNFSNPLGSLMPDQNKRDLAELLGRHEIPLIEDDVYGDLGFGPARPNTVKAYDGQGLVLLCSSFSKALAPGYRVGWIAPGRFQAKVERLKSLLHTTTASPTQFAIAEFLASGGYDRHVRALRRTYADRVAHFRDAISRHFPEGTRVTRPAGGSVVWVEMPGKFNSLTLWERALEEGIAIAPGMLFSTTRDFRNCIRLNAAYWSDRVAKALRTLGRLAKEMA
jgi:DNA-binding transcriptional MocR family regulator